MSTSSTPMFCLLVRAPISSQIKTARLNGHNTSGPLCTLRLFTPYHLIQFVLPCPLLSGPSPAVNVTVPGISSCSLAAYPSLANSASLCFEAENSCGLRGSAFVVRRSRYRSAIPAPGFTLRARLWKKTTMCSSPGPTGC